MPVTIDASEDTSRPRAPAVLSHRQTGQTADTGEEEGDGKGRRMSSRQGSRGDLRQTFEVAVKVIKQ